VCHSALVLLALSRVCLCLSLAVVLMTTSQLLRQVCKRYYLVHCVTCIAVVAVLRYHFVACNVRWTLEGHYNCKVLCRSNIAYSQCSCVRQAYSAWLELVLHCHRANVYSLLQCMCVRICACALLSHCVCATQVHSGESDFTPPRFKPAPDVYLR
jgi:hypothetical protein